MSTDTDTVVSAPEPAPDSTSASSSPDGRWSQFVAAAGPVLLAILAALAIGAVLIAWAGENPLSVYWTVFQQSMFERTGWRDTLSRAAPLTLIGIGLGIGFRSSIWNIGAEGQMVAGAVAAISVLGVTDLPVPLAITVGLILGAIGGTLWASIAGLLITRYGVNDVIATLLLAFTAVPLLNWVARDPLQDPESFLPQTRIVGSGELPDIPWLDTHIGIIFALVAVAGMAWLMRATRFGFIVRAHGANREAVYANESRRRVVTFGILALSGAFAGVAGYVVLAGEQIRVSGGTAAGFGFTAIIVAIVGRNSPIGVLVSAVGLSAMLVGAEAAQRETGLPVSLMQAIQALMVICIVGGNALAERRDRSKQKRLAT